MKMRIKMPRCDFCGTYQATIDGKTLAGPWAFMCEGCFKLHGIGLGKGRGEELSTVVYIKNGLYLDDQP